MLINKYGKGYKPPYTTCAFQDGSVFLYPNIIRPIGIKHKGKRPTLVILPYEAISNLKDWKHVVHCQIGQILIL